METISVAPTSASYSMSVVGDRLSTKLDGPASRFRTALRNTPREVSLMWTVGFDGFEALRAIFRKNAARGNPPWSVSLVLDGHAPATHTIKFVRGTIAFNGRVGLQYTYSARCIAVPTAVLSSAAYPSLPS
jgi:hypothetical protein